MIKFFRNIRMSLLNEGKTSRYLKYAFGEIILVVIGILIALGISNWNESKKNRNLRLSYSTSLINNLNEDIVVLNSLILQLKNDSIIFSSIEKRVRDSNADTDTIAKIFRYEFPAYVRSDYSFNNTALMSLLGNSTISYPPEIRQTMADLIKSQNDFEKTNTSFINEYFNMLNSVSGYPMENYFFNGGKAMRDKIWNHMDPDKLIAHFEGLSDWKFAYTEVIKTFSIAILTSTHELKSQLEELEGLEKS